ncbi:CHAT domain-containing protein [Actinocrispum wychmicini]|uniref:CHAT domain-containing protein n=1 Tax=Actinocrispum wychmicini TaxID=1213861 RepID=A0A4R2JC11_9PSEU|nr:CHAT domain-containing protein [Actinocrispum wychmicini]TCO54268.1 CHAT domain-containing protein [Actinocrispum wychmicini]
MFGSLPPTLAAVVTEAITQRQQVGALDTLRAALQKDPSSARSLAYHDVAKLKVALDEFDALPADTPHRTKIAAALAWVCVGSSIGDLDHEHLDRAAVLAEIAEPDPDVPPEWRVFFGLLRGNKSMGDVRKGSTTASSRALRAEFEGYRKLVDAVPGSVRREVSAGVDAILAAFDTRVAYLEADPGRESELLRETDGMVDSAAPASHERVRAEILLLLKKTSGAGARGEHQEGRRLLRSALDLAEELPATDPIRQALAAAAPNVMVYLNMPAGDGTGRWATSEADRAELDRLCRSPDIPDDERATHMFALAMIRMREQTPASMDEAVDLCERALPMSPPGGVLHSRHLATMGIVRAARWQMFGDPDDHGELAAGIACLEQARANAVETGNVDVLVSIGRDLSQMYLMDGCTDSARETAITGLRGRVWSAVLQSRAADVHLAIGDAADDAYWAAQLFLKSNRFDLAAWALEMGRGLIIHAATETRDIPTRLAEHGKAELAREWLAAPADQIPSELRRRVMSALAGVELAADGSLAADFDTAMRLVPDPPSPDEIRAALMALDMDALVYLVPGKRDGTGLAAVIPVSDHPHWITLPKLMTEQAAGFEHDLSAAAREVQPIPGRRTDTVDTMCEWAWESAIGPLLADVETSKDVPRIVLIPVRELSRIPWHAAWRTVDGRVRYAVEDAVFSYAASARMFCTAAWSGDVALTDGMIVSDPDTAGAAQPLPGARAEAAAIRERFYPNARLVGRAADGTEAADGRGLSEDVRSWLADPQGGTLLHLACHATVNAGRGKDDTSYLLLCDAERLSAEEFVDASSSRDLAVAVIAACRSNESGRGYDEAFSLATAFLAHNTRSVISARWNVPDNETSVLMYMFHHFLREEGLRPADALRAAQLWMIRAGELPAGTPAILNPLASPDVRTWAAFVHSGR